MVYQSNDYPPLRTDECRVIWANFIMQMLKDSTYGLYKRCKKRTLEIDVDRWMPPTGYIAHARDAQLWFLSPTRDFEDICGFVDLDPVSVREQALDMFRYMNDHVPDKYKVRGLDGSVLY